ncbi:MAG TPA: calcium-binding protein [Tepidisphaeraceae bacterium]|nr:calcium-binding protein [Tepidisphaeraceae bacterium]
MLHHFEQLETRRLLTIPVSGTVLNLTDTPDLSYITAGNDVLEIVLVNNVIQVRNGAGVILDSRPAAGLTGISVNAGSGNDFVRMGRANGTLMPKLQVTLHGGAGSDTLTGGNGNDQLFGDNDNDRLDGRAGQDVMNGGAGFDTVDYSYRAVKLNITLTNGVANDGSNSGNNSSPAQYNDLGKDNAVDVEGAVGGGAADNLVGNAQSNWLDGGGGNDSILAGAGIDTIIGGVNADLAYGQEDDDFFFMQDSTGDRFLGGDGSTIAQFDSKLDTQAPPLVSQARIAAAVEDDASGFVDRTLTPKEVQDFNFDYIDESFTPQPLPEYLIQRVKALKPGGAFELSGTPFNDVIRISQKNGIVTANINGFLWQQTAVDVTSLLVHLLGGNDQLIVDPSIRVSARIEGGDGNDTVFGSRQNDVFTGGEGNDLFLGNGGSDLATGEGGNDLLVGGTGADSLQGDAGRDILIGGANADDLQGGADEDVIDGGTTLLDNDQRLLSNLLANWGRNARISDGFFVGNFSRAISSVYLRSQGLNAAFDDNASDNLTGDAGADWFFARTIASSQDLITDLAAGDHLVEI